MASSTRNPDVLIVGAGLAGAATAFFLSRERGLSIALLEQEREAGAHSSGRSAGLVRRASGDPELDRFCDEGAAFLAAPPADFPADPHFRRTGSFLLLEPEKARAWRRGRMRLASHEELKRAVPPFEPDPRSAALCCEEDGVVEPASLLCGFLAGARARGVEIRIGERAGALLARDGRILGVALEDGRVECGCVVNAAGAWAGELARTAGAEDRQLAPMRRHLMVTHPDPRADPRWPWVWDIVRGFYFRPETGGLLLCACDEQRDRAGDCAADPEAAAAIAAKVERCLPALADLKPLRLWAGHRTRRPDGRFVLGPDVRVRGLVWAAGLGGHGVTAAAAVGRVAAEAALLELRRSR